MTDSSTFLLAAAMPFALLLQLPWQGREAIFLAAAQRRPGGCRIEVVLRK